MQYKKGLLAPEEYEKAMKEEFSYGTMDFEKKMERKWPFHEREWNRLLGIAEAVRRKGDYEEQKKLLTQMLEILERPYMEQEELCCKECLIKAYYLNKALFPENKLYEQKICLYYPDVLA